MDQQTFTLTTEMSKIPLIVTKKALEDFRIQGLEAMDDCLIRISDHMTPANAPEMRLNPLNMVGKMMLEGADTGNTRKVMLCALWITHHYPSVSGLVRQGAQIHFSTDETTPPKLSAVLTG